MPPQTNKTVRKVKASTAGAGVGAALSIIAAFILGQFGVEIPVEVQGAGTVLFSSGLAWIFGYTTKAEE